MQISRKLSREVDKLSFNSPVAHTYNPLVYARRPHEAYLDKFGDGSKEVVLVGMNPGPFGMAQTGVPFGDISMVRDWLGIEARVLAPRNTHPKRPIVGFSCTRKEVSGTRLWGWARDRFETPERFFSQFFVLNYCPLVFLENSGRNRTPDKLNALERAALFARCDAALAETLRLLQPRFAIGVGAFAAKRVDSVLAAAGNALATTKGRTILHPSPASPKANRGWAPQIEQQLEEIGISLP